MYRLYMEYMKQIKKLQFYPTRVAGKSPTVKDPRGHERLLRICGTEVHQALGVFKVPTKPLMVSLILLGLNVFITIVSFV